MVFREWLESWCIEILEETGNYTVKNRYEEPKKEKYESPAYKRLYKLITTLRDLSPTVKEIKIIKSAGSEYAFSIETSMGTRYIVSEPWCIKFGEEIPVAKELTNHTMCYYTSYLTMKYLYSISICSENKIIDVKPTLNCDAPMTEEDIYNSITEIENILQKYDYKSKRQEHQDNLKKFIGRFDG